MNQSSTRKKSFTKKVYEKYFLTTSRDRHVMKYNVFVIKNNNAEQKLNIIQIIFRVLQYRKTLARRT